MSSIQKQRQQYRDSYMEAVALSPDCPVLPREQTAQANHWWPGTEPSTFEVIHDDVIRRTRRHNKVKDVPDCHLPKWVNPRTGVCEHTDHDEEDTVGS